MYLPLLRLQQGLLLRAVPVPPPACTHLAQLSGAVSIAASRPPSITCRSTRGLCYSVRSSLHASAKRLQKRGFGGFHFAGGSCLQLLE